VRTFLLEIWEGLLIALRAIGTHKMRAVLTTLGIIIGIASVTSMATVINGIERGFEDSMSELGTDVLYVEKWPWVSGPGFKWWNYINRPEITADLVEPIRARARYAQAAVPVVQTSRTVVHGSTTLSGIRIEGSLPEYPRVHTVELGAGRFYTDIENRSARLVCVIGAEIADQFFPVAEPIGKYIRIDGNRFQVIGVLERKGTSADGPDSADQQIKIPYNTFKNLFGVSRRSVSVQVKVAEAALVEEAKDELTGIVRAARGLDAMEENDFEINEQQSLREQLAPVKLTIYFIGIFLTALALLVGGIGVMNIMFVSVKERTREIGIRKAVGAKRHAILIQFLIEAVIICLLGGLIGVLLSVVLTVVINLFITALLPAATVAVAFLICLGVGVIFGLAPAWAAAKAEPIEALRYE
jgi:putative ABC transport system permease protein